jgi:hypothetical protein
MRMRVCYLDCHEAGLCCYLVIHRKPITSITVGLLLFVAYLLTLPRILLENCWVLAARSEAVQCTGSVRAGLHSAPFAARTR